MVIGSYAVGIPEHGAEIGEQADAEAGCGCLRIRYKRYSRYTGALRPLPPAAIGDREQGFPHVGVAVPIPSGISGQASAARPAVGRPTRRAAAQRVAFGAWSAAPPRLDRFGRCPATHPDDDRRVMIVSGRSPSPASATAQ